MTLATVLFLTALLALAGLTLLDPRGELRPEALAVLGFLGGLLGLHTLLLYSHLVGLAWSRGLLMAALLPAAALGLLRLRRPGLRSGGTPSRSPVAALAPVGWGDALALAVVAGTAALAYSGWTASPDFVYHWGVKGHRFFLAQGLDLELLAAPWNRYPVHPDYPNLLPGLFAATALVRGAFHDTAGLFWAPVQMALMLLAVRWWLSEEVRDRFAVQAGIASLAGFLGATQIALRRAGDADWAIALVLLAAAPLLARPPRADDDLPVGLLAAFAAASKMEGLPLAAFLVAIHGLRRVRQEGRLPAAALGRWLLPVTLVVAPWAWTVWRHGLFSPGNLGAPRIDQLGPILATVLDRAVHANWHGFGIATLLLLPLLLVPRWLRPLGLLTTLQLGFYLFAYLATPFEASVLVVTSFPRLLWHLAPVALVAAVVIVGRARDILARQAP